MKFKNNRLSLTLASLLPFMPLLRSALPMLEFERPSVGIVLRWAIGAVVCGYDAVSRASSVAISPPTATIALAYAGTLTYSGGHAGSVSSMRVNGNCLGSYTANGLTFSYNGGHTISVTGTPAGSAGTMALTIGAYDASQCGGGESDTRSTSLIIQSSGGGAAGPLIVVSPQSTVAQVGSDVILSGGASGNPSPSYFWKQGITAIPGATQNTLTILDAQPTNAGLYTLYASNASGVTSANCYLSMVLTPGSNILALLYTNYVVAATPVTMTSFITNVPAANDTYSWQFNNSSIGVTTSNLSLTASQVTPAKSGTYSVTFNSVNGSTTIVNEQQYNSYWVFGFPPAVSVQPGPVTAAPGSPATLSFTLGGGNYSTVFLYQNGTNLVAETNLSGYNPATAAITTNISFTLSNVVASNSGNYTFIATNYWGAISSSAAVLTVGSPLSVTTPASETVYVGQTAMFGVTATGPSPIAYQWQKGGANLSDGAEISGSLTNTLVISPASAVDIGAYEVVVSSSGASVTNGLAELSVVPVPSLGVSSGGGTISLSAAGGIVGSNYVVEVTTNLANTNSWVPVLTNVVPGGGVITYSDTNAPGSQERFYRLQFP